MRKLIIIGVLLLVVSMSGCTERGGFFENGFSCEADGGSWGPLVGAVDGRKACYYPPTEAEALSYAVQPCERRGLDGLSMWSYIDSECVRLDNPNKQSTVRRRQECMTMLVSGCCWDVVKDTTIKIDSSLITYSVEEQEECMKVIEQDCCRDVIK